MSLTTLLDDFSLFDEWEERYRYIIELGNGLTPLAENEYNEHYKVQGCVSQVWLVGAHKDGIFHFRGDSDAHIVRGLIAILFMLYNGKTAKEILAFNIEEAFRALGLSEHLTPQRSNGFQAMVQRIRKEAEASLSDCKP